MISPSRWTPTARLALVVMVVVFCQGWVLVACAGEDSSGGLDVLTPPASPAFTLLNISPQVIHRPETLQDLGVDLQSGVTGDGRAISGFAIEVSANEILKPNIDLNKYRSSWLRYALYNLRMSLGTVRTTGDSASTDVALGLSFPLFNLADAMRDTAFSNQLAKILLEAQSDQPGADKAAKEATARARAREHYTNWSIQHWNASRAEIAVAIGGRMVDSRFDRFYYMRIAAWCTAALRLGGWGQFLALARYDQLEDLPGQPAGDQINYGGRVMAGNHGFNLYVEMIGRRSSFDEAIVPGGIDTDNSGSWAFGLEYHIAKGLWVMTGIGSRFDDALTGADRSQIALGLKWGLANSSRLGHAQ